MIKVPKKKSSSRPVILPVEFLGPGKPVRAGACDVAER